MNDANTQPPLDPNPAPSKASRPWVVRHKILTLIGALVAVIVIVSVINGAGGGTDDAATGATASASPATASAPKESAEKQPASRAPVASATPAPQEPAQPAGSVSQP